MSPQTTRVIKIVSVSLVAVLILGVIGFLIWAVNPSKAESAQLAKVTNDNTIKIEDKGKYYIMYKADARSDNGFIFYPGGHVDPQAYLYKLSGLVTNDVATVFVTKPFLNLAVLDINLADNVIADNPGIAQWTVGGHSLGGAMACQYLDHNPRVRLLVMIAAYCNNDISSKSVEVLSLVGAQDALATPDKVATFEHNLPTNHHTTVKLDNMNHAGWGNYGIQSGDRTDIHVNDEDVMQQIVDNLSNFWSKTIKQ